MISRKNYLYYETKHFYHEITIFDPIWKAYNSHYYVECIFVELRLSFQMIFHKGYIFKDGNIFSRNYFEDWLTIMIANASSIPPCRTYIFVSHCKIWLLLSRGHIVLTVITLLIYPYFIPWNWNIFLDLIRTFGL